MPSSRTLTLMLLGLVASGNWQLCHAQCPDGTPPPCRAPAAARRADPPIDEKTWIVLPFVNTAGSADAAMLSQASVNLLYQDIAGWQDLRAISDDRVADLLRGLPVAERERPGLQSGLSLARRVGAGRLVLGDYLALGGQAQLNAKVYDVKSGQQLRLVHVQLKTLASLDSITAGFGRLARFVLNVPALSGADAGVGTSSLEAYREYTEGMRALARIRLDTAVAHFYRAVAIDSMYALAHLRLFESIVDINGAAVAERNRQLDLAVRAAQNLPPHERLLVQAHWALKNDNFDELCPKATALLAADSTDAEAWMLLGLCHAADFRLAGVSADSVHIGIRGDLGAGLAAVRRSVSLAPGTVAAASLMQLLGTGALHICAVDACGPREFYVGAMLVNGDSARVDLVRWNEARSAPPYLAPEAVANRTARLREARAICEQIVQGSGSDHLVELLLFRYDVALGDTAAAVALLPRVAQAGDAMARLAFDQVVTLALQRGRPADARPWLDSAYAPDRSLFGDFREGGDTSLAQRQSTTFRQMLAGVLPAGYDTLEARIAARLTGPAHDDFLQLSTLAAFRMRHGGPALDTAAAHPLKRAQAWLARGDTTRARAALAEFDRVLAARHPATPDDGGWLFDAELHLDLRDSSAAWSRMNAFAQRWPQAIPTALEPYILDDWYFQRAAQRLWGRSWLLYADLAAALGHPAEARRGYQMVVGLWEHGDPPVQPSVARARAALAALGS